MMMIMQKTNSALKNVLLVSKRALGTGDYWAFSQIHFILTLSQLLSFQALKKFVVANTEAQALLPSISGSPSCQYLAQKKNQTVTKSITNGALTFSLQLQLTNHFGICENMTT